MVLTVKFAKGGGRIQSSLPPKDNKPIAEAVQKLYSRIVEGEENGSSKKRNKAGKWKDFACALRKSLDQSFEPHWHVVLGQAFGFHCKSKQVARLVISGCKDLKSSESLTVIIWKSPSVEPPSSESSPTPEKTVESSSDGKQEDPSSDSKVEDTGNTGASSRFHLLQPSENEIEAGSEIESTVNVLREMFQSGYPKDSADLAKHARKCLTEKLGTIWHVIVGQVGDYVLDHAEDCEISVTASIGKEKITCFRHAQAYPKLIDWNRLASTIPYAVIVLVCFAYMAFHSICRQDTASDTTATAEQPYRPKGMLTQAIENNICSKPDWDFELGVVAVVTVVSSFFAKRLLRSRGKS